MKDFSYDANANRVESASNLIVKNLAGSLALVTCREPLKMSLSNNIKQSIENIKKDLFDKGHNVDFLSENAISDFATNGSRENIELGCKEIKNEVIDQALTKVREDT